MKTAARLAPLILAAALAGCDDEIVCPAGETDCRGRCVSLLSDEANCGACGRACSSLEACSAGACGCAPGIASCGGACTDLHRDPANCGGCGAACTAGELCHADAPSTVCVASCPEGRAACAGACVDLASDRFHCGACGRACSDGERCRAGACAADLHVACFASGDVRPVTSALEPAGEARLALGSPTALAIGRDALYAASGFPASVAVMPLDPTASTSSWVLPGDDLQAIEVHGGAVLVSNAGVGTLGVLDAAGRFVDEIVLPGTAPNPHGLAVLDDVAYVTLYGNGPDPADPAAVATGQRIVEVDLAGIAACPPLGSGGCGTIVRDVDLRAIPGSSDGSGLPFPTAAAAGGGRVYAALSNLEYAADCGGFGPGWCRPAGHGKLAIVLPGASGAVSIVDLGPSCGNPGDVALHGSTLWVACGSFAFGDLYPGALVPVDVSGAPTAGAPLALPAGFVPGKLAFCGGAGYVTDQASGAVLRFDPEARTASEPVVVCPTVFFAWASDIACSE